MSELIPNFPEKPNPENSSDRTALDMETISRYLDTTIFEDAGAIKDMLEEYGINYERSMGALQTKSYITFDRSRLNKKLRRAKVPEEEIGRYFRQWSIAVERGDTFFWAQDKKIPIDKNRDVTASWPEGEEPILETSLTLRLKSGKTQNVQIFRLANRGQSQGFKYIYIPENTENIE